MSTLPVTPAPVGNTELTDTEKCTYAFTLFDSAPVPQPILTLLPDDPPITVIPSSPSVTIVPDAVPASGTTASGFCVGGVPGLAVTVTASYTPGPTALAAGAVPVVKVATIDVLASADKSATFVLGTPVSQ
jgi:hypothetical protein